MSEKGVPYNPTVPSIFRCKQTLEIILVSFFTSEELQFRCLYNENECEISNFKFIRNDYNKTRCAIERACLHVLILSSVCKLLRSKIMYSLSECGANTAFPFLKWMSKYIKMYNFCWMTNFSTGLYDIRLEFFRLKNKCDSLRIPCELNFNNMHYGSDYIGGNVQLIMRLPHCVEEKVLEIDLRKVPFLNRYQPYFESTRFMNDSQMIDNCLSNFFRYIQSVKNLKIKPLP